MRAAKSASIIVAAFVGVALLAAPAPAGQDTRPVYSMADGTVIDGASSSLVRNASGAKVTFKTNGLDKGHAVTLWVVIFNEPANCEHGHDGFACGPGDLPPFGGDDSAVTSVLYGAGNVIGGSGKTTLSAHRSVGDNDNGLWGPGLVNPHGAEIHLVLRDHGPKKPGETDDAIHSFGFCNPECLDLQFAVHD